MTDEEIVQALCAALVGHPEWTEPRRVNIFALSEDDAGVALREAFGAEAQVLAFAFRSDVLGALRAVAGKRGFWISGASDVEMAALALVAITAHLGLFYRVNLVAGETVFVNGGTGGVGSTVVQMAKAAGATVVCTVGSVEKAEVARGFGADVVVNYKTDDVSAAVLEATAGKGVDVYYETQPPTDFEKIVERTAAYGRVVVMAGRAARPVFPNGPFYVKGLSLYGFAMFNVPPDRQRTCSEAINRWVHEGVLKPLVGKVFALSEAGAAHRLQDENTLGQAGTLMGKIVVLPGS